MAWRSFTSSAVVLISFGCGSSCSWGGWARWFTCWWRRFQTPACSGSRSKFFPRRRRIRELEAAILDNPSAGTTKNWPICTWRTEVRPRPGVLRQSHLVANRFAGSFLSARRVRHRIGRFPSAVADLERVIRRIRSMTSSEPQDLLAHAYANTGQAEKAEAIFREVTVISTFSETYYNYALFLASQSGCRGSRMGPEDPGEETNHARISRRRERPWFRSRRPAEEASPHSCL